MSKEIEIQVKIEKSDNLIDFLKKNARFEFENRQVDQYFTPSHRNFLAENPVREWLRLRNDNGKFSINYKNWHYDEDGKANFCDEFETEIKDVEELNNILNNLDFKKVTVVDKIRRVWKYKDWEISIDSVKNLGDFVEIEQKVNDENPDDKKIVSDMVAFLQNLDCGEIRRNFNGYAFLSIWPDKGRWEVL